MLSTTELESFETIISEMELVYKHDNRPWMIGFSGGKDSTLLCCLVMTMLQRLAPDERNKKTYIVSSDTGAENPIVKDYMHKMSRMIGEAGKSLNVVSEIIYPEPEESFWAKVIGKGYPTPEAPGFRWCTERLKIKPMNKFTFDTIKTNGEVVLLLGVRKDESVYRANNIKSREIEGKLLVPHNDIEKAYVYNPLTEIPNEVVWKYLLKDDAKTPWGSDNKYLFSLYQGENLGEEASVIGEVDKDKIPITGNSRFGCWVCTMVKEDKSLKAFIDKGETWLVPLREYRNWLVELRADPSKRETKRRNGSVYLKPDGTLGAGPFTFETRKEMLRRLLQLEVDTGLDLISVDELKAIDVIWDEEGDISRRQLVDLYYEIKGTQLPWDSFKVPIFEPSVIEKVKDYCKENDVEYELILKLIISIEANKNFTRSSIVEKNFDKILNEGWLHFDAIQKGLTNEN